MVFVKQPWRSAAVRWCVPSLTLGAKVAIGGATGTMEGWACGLGGAAMASVTLKKASCSAFSKRKFGGGGKALFFKLLERLQGFEEAPLAGGGVAMREAGLLVDWPDNVPG